MCIDVSKCKTTVFKALGSSLFSLPSPPLLIPCPHLAQPTASKFPPPDTELGEGAIPLPSISWSALQPHGLNRLLPLPLWLSLQYLGKELALYPGLQIPSNALKVWVQGVCVGMVLRRVPVWC